MGLSFGNIKIPWPFVMVTFVVSIASVIGISSLFSEGDQDPYLLGDSLYRGAILDRAGTVLAISQKSISAFVRPSILSGRSEWIPEVSKILGLNPEDLKDQLRDTEGLVWLKDDLSTKEYMELRDRHLDGIETIERYRRVYPYGVLASPVLGFVGHDGRGLEGIECAYDRLLSQSDPHRSGQGQELTISIERGIQLSAERELLREINRLKANRGCFVIMDIRDGEILAMASRPSWDPRRFWKIPTVDIVNYSLQDNVDPAVLIPVLGWIPAKSASGPESHSQSETPEWIWKATGDGVVLWGPWAEVDPVYCADISTRLWDLGFGQLTGIDLPGEHQGGLPSSFSGPGGHVSYRGIRANSIQILRAFSALITGTRLVRPHLALRGPKGLSSGLKTQSQAEIPWLTEGQAMKLRKRLAAWRGPSLASIVWDTSNRGVASVRSLAQVMALGFWPPGSPKVSYIFLLEGVRKDPRDYRGILGRPLRVAREAAQLPM